MRSGLVLTHFCTFPDRLSTCAATQGLTLVLVRDACLMTAGQFLLAEGISDTITKEHWVQSGFANTNLDYQPKEHGIKNIVVLAMVASA